MVTSYFLWWYSSGWKQQFQKTGSSLVKLEDLFSISQLLRTMFAPWHQYSANEEGKGPTEALKAWFNRMFSRCFGFILRTFVVVLGSLVLVAWGLIKLVWLVLWPVLPLAPVLYVVAIVTGVI